MPTNAGQYMLYGISSLVTTTYKVIFICREEYTGALQCEVYLDALFAAIYSV